MRGRVLQNERRNARHDLRLYPELAMRAFGLAGLRLRRRAPLKGQQPLARRCGKPLKQPGRGPWRAEGGEHGVSPEARLRVAGVIPDITSAAK